MRRGGSGWDVVVARVHRGSPGVWSCTAGVRQEPPCACWSVGTWEVWGGWNPPWAGDRAADAEAGVGRGAPRGADRVVEGTRAVRLEGSEGWVVGPEEWRGLAGGKEQSKPRSGIPYRQEHPHEVTLGQPQWIPPTVSSTLPHLVQPHPTPYHHRLTSPAWNPPLPNSPHPPAVCGDRHCGLRRPAAHRGRHQGA